jgi:TonB-dependent starch-binding outer membrane protein SusC
LQSPLKENSNLGFFNFNGFFMFTSKIHFVIHFINLNQLSMKRFLLLCFALCVAIVGESWAQTRTVTGKVIASDGSALPAVSIRLKGTTTGAITDVDGNYRINVPQTGGVLVFSSVGYTEIEEAIGNRTVINVTLQDDVRQLSEVVITGYGEQEKREVTGAISQIKGSTIENLPLQSFDRALQGRASGVQVRSNNGIPGGAVNIRIRGTGSISAGNQPLFIVDGVQLNSTDNAANTQSNPLNFLNPNDIESMEILKDAAAAAIYGAQAANGVVIITTKKGKAGRSRIEFNSFAGYSEPFELLDVLNANEWYEVRTDAFRQAGSSELVARANALNNMGRLPADWQSQTPEQLDALAAGLPTYNWQEEAFRRGIVQNYELSMSGGDDKTTFFVSGSYNQQDAIIYPVDFERGTLRLNLNHKATQKFSVETSLNLSTFEQNVPFSTDGSFLGSPAFSSSTVLPHNPIYNEDGTFNTNILGVLNQNVIAVANWTGGKARTNQAVGNMTFSYRIKDNLSFRSLWGMDYRVVQTNRYTDPRTPDGAGVGGRASQQDNWNVNFITTQTLNYNTKIGSNHNISAIGGVEYRSETNEQLSGSGIGFPTPQFRTIQSAATPESITSFWTGYRRIGTFARANYDFRRKYMATVTMRYDGSSRFGADNRFGFFPSFSMGWYLKEEPFLANNQTISELKLRASFGRTGNDQIGNFSSRGLYGGTGNYAGQPGIRPSGLANTLLGWETNQTINIGLDYGFLNNRFTGAIEVFERTSKDLLLDQPILWTSGYGSITTNVGELVNRGVEFELTSVNIDRGGFRWNTSFNISYIENEVTKLYGGLTELPSDPSIRIGESLGSYYSYKHLGVNPATGRNMWEDVNGDPTYIVQLADRRIVGNSLAPWFGGLTNTFSYKGLELITFFNYEYGRLVSDGQYGFLRENGARLTLNALRETVNARWQQPGDITHQNRVYNGGTEQRISGMNTGTASLIKADYIRLKQLTLAYSVPVQTVQRLGLTRARVYVQGVNLWTYADYPGYDPEWFGSATGIIPQGRNYTVGLQVGF